MTQSYLPSHQWFSPVWPQTFQQTQHGSQPSREQGYYLLLKLKPFKNMFSLIKKTSNFKMREQNNMQLRFLQLHLHLTDAFIQSDQ